jgi:hypothetical protein
MSAFVVHTHCLVDLEANPATVPPKPTFAPLSSSTAVNVSDSCALFPSKSEKMKRGQQIQSTVDAMDIFTPLGFENYEEADSRPIYAFPAYNIVFI